MIDASSSLVDVCFEVCTALDRAGVVAVLCGGSAATYYAPLAYQSRDADFVIMLYRPGHDGTSALRRLGYVEQNGMYVHPNNRFTVEFPAGPLGIGDDLIATWDTVQHKGKLLHVVTRTDCVRDRLASFYFYADRSALAAALAVARSGSINLETIKEWSSREREDRKFQIFAEELLGT